MIEIKTSRYTSPVRGDTVDVPDIRAFERPPRDENGHVDVATIAKALVYADRASATPWRRTTLSHEALQILRSVSDPKSFSYVNALGGGGRTMSFRGIVVDQNWNSGPGPHPDYRALFVKRALKRLAPMLREELPRLDGEGREWVEEALRLA